MLAQEAKYQAFKGKVLQLNDILESQGLDSSALMDEVGLTEHLKSSTVVVDSHASIRESYPSYQNATGAITSSVADSVGKNSGLETSDDDIGDGRRVSFLDQNGFRRVIEEGDEEAEDTSASDVVGAAASKLAGSEGFGRLEI